MKKIMVLIPSYRLGGAEKMMVMIANIFSESYDVTIVTLEDSGELINDVSAKINRVSLNTKKASSSYFKLKRLLKKSKPDYVFSTHDRLNVLNIMLRKSHQGKAVVRLVNHIAYEFEKMNSLKAWIYKKIYFHYYKKAKYIIAQCQEMKSELAHYLNINEDNIEVIYNAVDTSVFKEKIPKPKDYPSDKMIFLAVGRLVYEKGFDVLIDALGQYDKKNYKCFIIGEGPLKEALNKQIKHNHLEDNVILLGKKKPIEAYFQHADLFILPSRLEGFPNVLLEALAANTRVLSSDCKYGIHEIKEKSSLVTTFKNESASSLLQGLKNVDFSYQKGNTAFYYGYNRLKTSLEKYISKNERLDYIKNGVTQ